ncbi:hypothetical protein AB0C51_10525 [Streptomyces pathocidini]|uniref:hypothetical protein n=1 Tax=Streptomyces pathocidini TaxID=1650571 RepID=UPI0033E8C9B7
MFKSDYETVRQAAENALLPDQRPLQVERRTARLRFHSSRLREEAAQHLNCVDIDARNRTEIQWARDHLEGVLAKCPLSDGSSTNDLANMVRLARAVLALIAQLDAPNVSVPRFFPI